MVMVPEKSVIVSVTVVFIGWIEDSVVVPRHPGGNSE